MMPFMKLHVAAYLFSILQALSAGCMFVAIEFFRFMGPLKGEIVDKMVMLAPGGIMIVLTILLFVIGMIGLCGACQESKCLQGTVGQSLHGYYPMTE